MSQLRGLFEGKKAPTTEHKESETAEDFAVPRLTPSARPAKNLKEAVLNSLSLTAARRSTPMDR